jgi:hypothetical protein
MEGHFAAIEIRVRDLYHGMGITARHPLGYLRTILLVCVGNGLAIPQGDRCNSMQRSQILNPAMPSGFGHPGRVAIRRSVSYSLPLTAPRSLGPFNHTEDFQPYSNAVHDIRALGLAARQRWP